MQRTSIRVGQRLIRWDGTTGYVAQNTKGQRVFGPGETFMVEWLGLDGTIEDAEYLTLEAFEQEGVRCGRGLMPWAKSEGRVMGRPLETLRGEWAQLVWDFLHRVSHDLRVPFDLAEEAEDWRGAMEKLGCWEMNSDILDRADRWQADGTGGGAGDEEDG